jgi:thioredoxin-related protein
LACSTADTPESVLNDAKDKLANASVISYEYRIETNNLFNETRYVDSAKVDFYRISDSQHGFGLHVRMSQDDYIYDGFELLMLEHDKSRNVQYDPQEFESDPEYFSRFTFFANNPMMISNDHEFVAIHDTLVNDQACFGYLEEITRMSNSDTTMMVRYQKWFFIEKEKGDIIQITDITIRERDTLQVVDCFFTDFTYKEEMLAFPKMDPKYERGYIKVIEENADEEFTYVPIREGEKLSKSMYIDVDGKEISLFGKDDKSCLIMFSFIGCAPCETALKDFKEANYDFSEEINFYYSSFQNESTVLKHYLHKKEFPNAAFGKESQMIEEFSLYHAPSFVLIDSNGVIQKVMEGYDEEVKRTLLEILSPLKD